MRCLLAGDNSLLYDTSINCAVELSTIIGICIIIREMSMSTCSGEGHRPRGSLSDALSITSNIVLLYSHIITCSAIYLINFINFDKKNLCIMLNYYAAGLYKIVC